VTFAPDSHWRGETHRLIDRPGTVHRLLEEVAAAGVTQIVVVSACAPESDPHRLRAAPLDPRQRLGEFIVAAEAAALRDALEMARLRFDAVFTIRPSHNALGPFDFAGAYDQASDRRQELAELIDRGYEDAGRQFIEPVSAPAANIWRRRRDRRPIQPRENTWREILTASVSRPAKPARRRCA
jgi:hypothetical protein